METRAAVPLLFYGVLWRGFGSKRAGRRVIESLDSSDETIRTMAGLLLVKGGRRAVPLIRETLASGRALPMLVRIAADLGATELLPTIRGFMDSADLELAQAARDAVAILERPDGRSE